MDFMIGYQQPDNGEYFAEIVEDYKDLSLRLRHSRNW
jgi:hypothetical protein